MVVAPGSGHKVRIPIGISAGATRARFGDAKSAKWLCTIYGVACGSAP